MARLEVLEVWLMLMVWMGVGEDEAGGRVVALARAAQGDEEEERLPRGEGQQKSADWVLQ